MSVVYLKREIGTPDGYYGKQEVKESIISDLAGEGVVAANIKKDAVVMGVVGTYVPTDENLVAENIKKGVTIFGVTGTYEGDTPTP